LESGKKLKEHGVSGGLAIPLGNDGAKFRGGAKTIASDVFSSHTGLMTQALKLREFMDHCREQWRIIDGGGANRKHQQAPG
jgi:hypothetical protein